VKLLLDEMLSPAIARDLRAHGHDAESVAGHPDRETRSDPEVLALARAGHRALVTNNLRDFRPLHVEAISPGGAGQFGMIFMPGSYRRTRADTGKIVAALEAVLSQYPGDSDLANGEAWLQRLHPPTLHQGQTPDAV
jgi:hypothetical protein